MSRFSVLTSRDNPQLKHAAKLAASSRSRKEDGLFVVEGVRLCMDALRSGLSVASLFYTPAAKERYPEAVGELSAAAGEVYETAPAAFSKISDTATPQGVLCLCGIPPRAAVEELDAAGRYLLLEQISDPANLGAMARTAEALGLSGLVLSPGCCDPYSPKSLRAGMGALFRLPLYLTQDFPAALDCLQQKGIRLYAALPRQDARKITELHFGPGCAVAVGNEGNGLTEDTISCCQPVTIPMGGRAESLNAAAAAAILMWEMLRENQG